MIKYLWCIWAVLSFLVLTSEGADVTLRYSTTAASVRFGWGGGIPGTITLPITNSGTATLTALEWLRPDGGYGSLSTDGDQPVLAGWPGGGTGPRAGPRYSVGPLAAGASGSTVVGLTVYEPPTWGSTVTGAGTLSTSWTARATFAGGVVRNYTVPFSMSVTLDGQYGVGGSMTPSTFTLPTLTVSNLAPTSSVGIVGFPGPPTFLDVSGPGWSGSLLSNGSTPVWHTGMITASTPDGSVFNVATPSGAPVGSGTVVYNGSGYFELLITCSAPAVTGTVDVVGSPETAGAAVVTLPGGETANITIPSSGAVTVLVEDPEAVVDGGEVTVTRNGQVVGKATIHKDAYGSFAESVVTAGEGDAAADDPNDGVFELDVVSYADGSTDYFVEIDGVKYTPEGGGTVVGDPVNGTRAKLKVKIPNSAGGVDESQYTWKATGQFDDKAVRDYTVVVGKTPDVPNVVPNVEVPGTVIVNGFHQGDVIVNGVPSGGQTPVTPPGSYVPDPEEIDYAKMRASVRDGVSDALKVAGNGLGGSAKLSTVQGEAGRSAGALGAKSLGQIGEAFSGLSAPGVTSFSTASPTFTVTLPVLGSVVLDSSVYGIWPGILRQMTLALVVWLSIVASFGIVKSGFAGK